MSLPSLLDALCAVPDHRRAAGRRHSLPAVLAFVCCGMLCGNRSLLAITEWGRAHQVWCCATFGFRRRTPCVNTLHRVLKGLDVAAFEAALPAWLLLHLDAPLPLEPIAIDGKVVRGARDQHLPGSYLLSAFAVRRGIVLAQVAIGDRENELTQARTALAQLDLTDAVVTGDALFAQRALCEQIVGGCGHYLLAVKENQLQLQQELTRSFRCAARPADHAHQGPRGT